METHISEDRHDRMFPGSLGSSVETQAGSIPHAKAKFLSNPSPDENNTRQKDSDMVIESVQGVDDNDENSKMEIENGDSLNSLDELENNQSLNRFTTESHSVPRGSQKDMNEELDFFEEAKTPISEKSGFRSQGKKHNNNVPQQIKPNQAGKSKMIKKSTSQKKDYPLKKSSSNKIGKNLQNVYKKAGGKNLKMSNGGVASAQPGEGTKKKYTKSPSYKTYQDLVQVMQNMQKFDWMEAAGITNKTQLAKTLTPHALWFMICANYFPKNAFTYKNNKEQISQKFENLRNYSLEVPQRLSKDCMKIETIERAPSNDLDNLLLSSISKAVKYSLDTYKSNDFLKKVITSRAVNTYDLNDYTVRDEEWTMETRRFIFDSFMGLQEEGFLRAGDFDPYQNLNLLSKIDLQDLITLHERDYYNLTLENESQLRDLEKRITRQLGEEEPINKLHFDPQDSLADLRFKFPENTIFISLLEKKKKEEKELNGTAATQDDGEQGQGPSKTSHSTKTVSRSHAISAAIEANSEDSVCQICNGEDYNDDDLLVFCSRCNISVHQKCYGIPTVPHDDWICELCLEYHESGKYMRCPLCTKRGGGLKPTSLRADTNLFENLNPSYHAFLKSYARPELFRNIPKKVYPPKPKVPAPESVDLAKKSDEDTNKNYLEDLYYNYFTISYEFSEEELKNEPRPVFVWAHVTCATFIPELYFSDDAYRANILGLEKLDRMRFKYECQICKTTGHGAIVNCAKETCKKAFHPECARRAKFCLEVKETEFGEFFYYIFCKKHTPLKLKRILESKENKIRDEIDRFFKNIEKCFATFVAENQQLSLISEQSSQKDKEKKLMLKNKLNLKDDRGYFMKLVEKYRSRSMEIPCTITVKPIRRNNEPVPKQYELLDYTLPRPSLKPDRRLTADDEIWAIMPYKNLTPEQKYEKYRKILMKLKKRPEPKEIRTKTLPILAPELEPFHLTGADDGTLDDLRIILFRLMYADGSEEYTIRDPNEQGDRYCLCQRIYTGEFMIACENCETWYHPECVGVPAYTDEEFEKLKWYCKDCSKKMGYDAPIYIFEEDIPTLNHKRPINYDIEEEPDYPMKKVKGKG